jgi:adenosylmethionine-8-amino-7-oxononanoate aminotransferase
MCLGKALTGGYLTLSAVVCRAAVAEGISGSESGVLMHGPTYMANPLACSVASASIDLLAASDWRPRVHQISERLSTGLRPVSAVRGVVDVRTCGAVGVVQIDRPVDVAAATQVALDHGVWLRPFRDLIYTMPPYICTGADIDAISAAIGHATRASLAGTG